jgi:hypothetical protein
MKDGISTKDIDTEKKNTPVRLSFQTPELAQASIGRLVRARYKNKITDLDYKSILYGYNCWLSYSKHIKENHLLERLEAIENMINNPLPERKLDQGDFIKLQNDLSAAVYKNELLEKELLKLKGEKNDCIKT